MKVNTYEKIKPLLDEAAIISTEHHMDEKLYNSPYESYAILKEEIETIASQFEGINKAFDNSWFNIKYGLMADKDLESIKTMAYYTIIELIELIGMSNKAITSEEKYFK